MFEQGDLVRRYVGAKERMVMYERAIDEVDDKFAYIYLGTKEQGWKFDRVYGYEVDEELGWGVPVEGGPDDGLIYTGTWIEKVES